MLFVYIILFVLFFPMIYIVIGGAYFKSKEIINSNLNELLKPDKGYYNFKKIELLDFVTKMRGCDIVLMPSIDSRERYIELTYLRDNFFTTTIRINIPHKIENNFCKELGQTYSEHRVYLENFFPILVLLLNKHFIFSYTDYPKEKSLNYCVKEYDGAHGAYDINSSKIISDKILALIKKNKTILKDYHSIMYKYKDLYAKIITKNNWEPQTDYIPEKWFQKDDLWNQEYY